MKTRSWKLNFHSIWKNKIIYSSFQYHKHALIHHKFTMWAYIAACTWRKIFVHVLLPLLQQCIKLRRSLFGKFTDFQILLINASKFKSFLFLKQIFSTNLWLDFQLPQLLRKTIYAFSSKESLSFFLAIFSFLNKVSTYLDTFGHIEGIPPLEATSWPQQLEFLFKKKQLKLNKLFVFYWKRFNLSHTSRRKKGTMGLFLDRTLSSIENDKINKCSLR